MDIIKLLTSMLRRVIISVSSPFRMMLVSVQRMLNANVISAKLIQPLTKNIKKLMRLRPTENSDYVKVGGFLVFKQLLMLLALASCAGVFIYFSLFAPKTDTAPITLTEIKTDVTFRYDDISVKEFSGVANITSYDGGVVYTGEIESGVCKGNGFLYSRSGQLLYQGGFGQNRYNGYGVSYSPEGLVIYEGEFSDNLYQGTGKLYSAAGKQLYDGGFKGGVYEGSGKLYSETGVILYDGDFIQGKRHGFGTQFYPDGAVQYKGEFFDDAFQGKGEFYSETGQLLYTGAMYRGQINYRALVDATLADVEAAFSETPVIYYQEDGNSCFLYEKAGIIITTDCRIKVQEWEREKENPSDGFYYMPDEIQESWEAPESDQDSYDIAPWEYDTREQWEAPESDQDSSGDTVWDTGAQELANVALTARKRLTLTPMNWVTIDPYSSGSSSGESSGSSSSDDSGSRDDNDSRSDDDSSADDNSAYDNDSSSSSDSESGASSQSILPEFIDKTKQLYFEVDKDIWQPEQSLDKAKVFIRRVTVLEQQLPPESGAIEIEDTAPASVEDCVAIDSIRKTMPTAFGEVLYEIEKQNKLFQRIWSINHANRIIRRTFVADDATYRFCYQPEDPQTPIYYSIEG